MWRSPKKREPERPNTQLVTEAAYTLVGCHTEDYREMTLDAKVRAIFEYHEAHVSTEVIRAAILARYEELQGEPAPAEEPS